MKAQLWKIWVTEGVLGMVHDQFFSIAEIHIPDLSMSINSVTYIPCTVEERYKSHHPSSPAPKLLAEMEIPDSIADGIELLKASLIIDSQIRHALEETFQTQLNEEELSLLDGEENENEDEEASDLIVPGSDLIIP